MQSSSGMELALAEPEWFEAASPSSPTMQSASGVELALAEPERAEAASSSSPTLQSASPKRRKIGPLTPVYKCDLCGDQIERGDDPAQPRIRYYKDGKPWYFHAKCHASDDGALLINKKCPFQYNPKDMGYWVGVPRYALFGTGLQRWSMGIEPNRWMPNLPAQ